MKHSSEFLKLVQDAKSRIRELTVEQVKQKLASGHPFHFIDVREDHEWNKSRCQGAKHLGRGILERDIETQIPNKKDEIVLYCGGGFRSALSADNMQKMGYSNVWSMDGGYRGWIEAGGPVENA